MNYGSLASSINEKCSGISEELYTMKSSCFDGIWSGIAKDALAGNFDNAVIVAKSQLEEVGNYSDLLLMVEEYKELTEKIDSLKNSLYNYQDDKYEEVRKKINNDIVVASNKAAQLRMNIIAKISRFSRISAQYEAILYTLEQDYKKYSDEFGSYMFDVDSLLSRFNDNSLSKMRDGDSLYNYFNKEDVENYINNIKENSSGRDAAVNCALGIISLASSVDLKLDYDWGGGHGAYTTLDNVANGVDCSAFASWCINQGATEDFATRTTASLKNVGEKTTYESAQKGDILVYNNGENGHVMIIVENDVENQRFVLAEASGANTGVKLSSGSYAEYSSVYSARDLTEYYS